jgi:hypothetical protein
VVTNYYNTTCYYELVGSGYLYYPNSSLVTGKYSPFANERREITLVNMIVIMAKNINFAACLNSQLIEE